MADPQTQDKPQAQDQPTKVQETPPTAPGTSPGKGEASEPQPEVQDLDAPKHSERAWRENQSNWHRQVNEHKNAATKLEGELASLREFPAGKVPVDGFSEPG